MINALALVSDDGVLATGCGDTRIRIWQVLGEFAGTLLRTLDGGALPVLSLCRLSDTRLASGSTDMTARVWCGNSPTPPAL